MDTNQPERSTDESPKTSRRTFLAAAAGAAGAAGTAGALFSGSAGASAVLPSAALATSDYSTAYELLYLDNSPVGFLMGRSGGLPFVELQPLLTTGPTDTRVPLGAVRFDPLILQVSAGLPGSFYQWIADSMQLQGVRKSGFIAFVGSDGNEGGRLAFTNALVSEVTLPALNAASREAVKLTITLVPEFTQLFLSPPTPVKHTIPLNTKAKSWLGSNFRLQIDKIDGRSVSLVEDQTITIKMATSQPGAEKIPTAAPVGIENGRLAISIRESDARQFLDWFNQLWGPKGNPSDPALLRSGTLTYVASDLVSVVGTVNFKNMGIARIEPERMTSSDSVRRVRIEMYVGSVALGPKSFT